MSISAETVDARRARALRLARIQSAVARAWGNAYGGSEGRHSLRVQRLHATWPALAAALDALLDTVTEGTAPAPFPCPRCGAEADTAHADVDPRTAGHLYRLSPCGCGVDRGTFEGAIAYGVTPVVTPVNGATLGAAERARQRTEEGHGIDDDLARHGPGDLAWAAWSYLDHAAGDALPSRGGEPPVMWPWPRAAWRPPSTPMRAIIIALALLQAELDRRLAAGETPTPRGEK